MIFHNDQIGQKPQEIRVFNWFARFIIFQSMHMSIMAYKLNTILNRKDEKKKLNAMHGESIREYIYI